MEFPSQTLLEKLMSRASGPVALHHALSRYSAIKSRLEGQRRLIEIERERQAKYIQKMESEIAIIQNECDHPDTTRHGDPSGGSDSYTVCNVCGAEVVRP